jgi:hypothetical protein
VTPFAHVGGMPLEELLAPAGGAGASLLAARVWLALHLRRRRAVSAPAARPRRRRGAR